MSVRTTWPELQANMAEVGRLQAEVKRRSMIFNCVEKELAAQFYGLPFDSFYELPFVQWVDVHRHYSVAARALRP